MIREFRDPADLPQASCQRDLAVEVDRYKDTLLEAAARMLARHPGPLPESRDDMTRMFRRSISSDEPGSIGWVISRDLVEQLAAAQWEAITHTLALIRDSADPKLAVDSLIFAAGMHGLQEGKSQTELGEESEVGRAAISKRVTAWQHALGLPPSPGMKDDEAQEVYRERAHEVHGTEVKEVGKECALLEAAMKRIARWIERVMKHMSKARDAAEGKARLRGAFAELQGALEAI